MAQAAQSGAVGSVFGRFVAALARVGSTAVPAGITSAFERCAVGVAAGAAAVLDLRRCALRDADAAALASALRECPCMCAVDVRDNAEMTIDGVCALYGVVRAHGASVGGVRDCAECLAPNDASAAAACGTIVAPAFTAPLPQVSLARVLVDAEGVVSALVEAFEPLCAACADFNRRLAAGVSPSAPPIPPWRALVMAADLALLQASTGRYGGSATDVRGCAVAAGGGLTQAGEAPRSLCLANQSLVNLSCLSQHCFEALVSLDVSGNMLSDAALTLDVWGWLGALTELDISRTSLARLPEFPPGNGLLVLRARGNRLRTAARAEVLQAMTSLDLSANGVAKLLSLRALSLCPRLQQLWLLDNPITAMSGYRRRVREAMLALTLLDGTAVKRGAHAVPAGGAESAVAAGWAPNRTARLAAATDASGSAGGSDTDVYGSVAPIRGAVARMRRPVSGGNGWRGRVGAPEAVAGPRALRGGSGVSSRASGGSASAVVQRGKGGLRHSDTLSSVPGRAGLGEPAREDRRLPSHTPPVAWAPPPSWRDMLRPALRAHLPSSCAAVHASVSAVRAFDPSSSEARARRSMLSARSYARSASRTRDPAPTERLAACRADIRVPTVLAVTDDGSAAVDSVDVSAVGLECASEASGGASEASGGAHMRPDDDVPGGEGVASNVPHVETLDFGDSVTAQCWPASGDARVVHQVTPDAVARVSDGVRASAAARLGPGCVDSRVAEAGVGVREALATAGAVLRTLCGVARAQTPPTQEALARYARRLVSRLCRRVWGRVTALLVHSGRAVCWRCRP